MNIAPAENGRLAMLALMPSTAKQMFARSGMPLKTVYQHLRYLNNTGRSHVREWIPGYRGKFEAIHVAGPGDDAICPLVLAKIVRESKRVPEYVRNAYVPHNHRDPLVAAFFGEVR